jgi:hypothetical protein
MCVVRTWNYGDDLGHVDRLHQAIYRHLQASTGIYRPYSRQELLISIMELQVPSFDWLPPGPRAAPPPSSSRPSQTCTVIHILTALIRGRGLLDPFINGLLAEAGPEASSCRARGCLLVALQPCCWFQLAAVLCSISLRSDAWCCPTFTGVLSSPQRESLLIRRECPIDRCLD